jgi:hypothetical protein
MFNTESKNSSDSKKRATTAERAQNYAKKSIECEKYKRLYKES